ncbi:exosortase B [Janthinobacterium psychrotolerans]|uniref:Exosortase B n=1 Tax=Janthinobacterium psychrotolerans TaxID=1747903 RepID=A0A1A7C8L4_9BURK|nr:exosortase B [Janthinobacterium psychrotolerans]OBV40663.1 exosortase B [Janthinobacterium psychrotolerans]
MAAPGHARPPARAGRALLPDWLPLAAGFLAMLLPSLVGLFRGIWSTEEQAHGPIILALSLWLIYRKWPEMLARSSGAPASRAGWPLLAACLLLYVLGRSQQILSLELLALVGSGLALLLIKRGSGAARVLWFPFFFMLFMVPLPLPLVTTLTMPMKMAVSYVTEHLLFLAGYPIARSGVILQIGQYQLLVADACAGLQTLLTLEALGLFYLNLVRHTSPFRNIVLALLIVPISFTANVIRVMVLTLITYYFGDAAGQGFLHGFAGMVLFISALLLILGMDSLLQWIVRKRDGGRTPAAGVAP